MSKRGYAKIAALLPVIGQMLESGTDLGQIEHEPGREEDHPVHNLMQWQRRKVTKILRLFRMSILREHIL